jgi:hypothetical protein
MKKTKPKSKPRNLGQPWIDVAASRIRAGEGEKAVMRDYGYVFIKDAKVYTDNFVFTWERK